jgi:hypothetical protein
MDITKLEKHIDGAETALREAQDALVEIEARAESGAKPRAADAKAAASALRVAAREIASALKAAP